MKVIAIICGLAMMMSATGCQTMGEHKVASGAAIGTLVGAAAGAALGGKNRGKGALIGAAAGAAMGTGVGYYLDRQAKKLEQIQDVEVMPVPAAQGEPEHLNLRMQGEVVFAQGSASLTPGGASRVAEIAATLREYPNSSIIVKGYTSSEGADDMNLALSKNRAEMVKNQLIANRIAPARITAIGMGESNPIGDNETEAGRAMNRRVELDIFPTAEMQ